MKYFDRSVFFPADFMIVMSGIKYSKHFKIPVCYVSRKWDLNPKMFKTTNPTSLPYDNHSVSLVLPDAVILSAGGR